MKPILFHIFGEPIFSYPLLMGLGWGVGFNLTQYYWDKFNLKKSDLWMLFLGTFLFGWIGAKVFFLIFSAPDRALDYSREVNFWLGGGFVFYGGFIFSALFALIYTFYKNSIAPVDLAVITPGLALGHAIGRLGCFLAGCCFGSHCDLPIGISFKGEVRHAVQLYEFACLLGLFYLTKRFLNKKRFDLALVTYLVGYGAVRFVLEFFRGDDIRGLFYGLSTSQWTSLLIIVVVLGIRMLAKNAVTR